MKSRPGEYVETEEEAAKRILEGFDLSTFETCGIMNNQVVMAIYKWPNKSRGGVLLVDDKESEYQGKTGLIIAMGPTAYEDDTGRWFKGKKPALGDWVVIRASDGWRLDLYGVQCRIFDDTLTKMVIPHPESVW